MLQGREGMCPNNCIGVNPNSIIGGGMAAVALSGIAGSALLPALGGLGLVGVAGATGLTVMSMQQCGGPFSCVAPTGQCCRPNITFRGPICPPSC